jgi:hypothetical protein
MDVAPEAWHFVAEAWHLATAFKNMQVWRKEHINTVRRSELQIS